MAEACGAVAARIEAASMRAVGLSSLGRRREAAALLDAYADEQPACR